MVAAGGMDRDACWFVDYEEACCGVVVDYFNGTGGDGGFVTVNCMGNAIAILDYVVLVDDFAVDCHCAFCNSRFIVLGLSVSKF